MTATDTPGPDPEKDWRFRTAMWLGHYADRLSIVGFAVMGTAFVVSTLLRDTSIESLSWLLVIPGLALILVSTIAQLCDIRVHRENLCLRDLDEAPLLDPQAEVTKHAHLLAAAHAQVQRIWILVVSLGFMFTGLVVGNIAYENDVPGAFFILTVPYVLMIVVQTWSVRVGAVHHRLQAWCPLCRWGRGPDDDPPAPEPEPTPPASEKDKITT